MAVSALKKGYCAPQSPIFFNLSEMVDVFDTGDPLKVVPCYSIVPS